jgi:hypothetical protein
MKTFAVIENENVINKIVADTKESAEQALNQITLEDGSISYLDPYQYTCIEYVVPEIGDSWNGTEFIKNI